MNPENLRNSTAGQAIRNTKGYWAFIPAPRPPELSWPLALVVILSEAERNLSKLASQAGVLPTPHLLVQPFVRREALISSRIEGTRASLSDLYTFETQLSFLEPATDVQEVHNYVEALDNGLERLKTLLVSLRLIREIHARLMVDVRGKHLTPMVQNTTVKGTVHELRRSQNWIGPGAKEQRDDSTLENAPYVPPPVDWEMRHHGYQLTRYADDWVVTCRSLAEAKAALATTKQVL